MSQLPVGLGSTGSLSTGGIYSTTTKSNGGNRSQTKTMNIAEKMKRIEKNFHSNNMSESSNNTDTLMSIGSTSSNDEAVTSTDQNQAKPKKWEIV